MDNKTNIGNMKNTLALRNLLKASGVHTTYIQSKKRQNTLHGIRGAPLVAFTSPPFSVGAS